MRDVLIVVEQKPRSTSRDAPAPVSDESVALNRAEVVASLDSFARPGVDVRLYVPSDSHQPTFAPSRVSIHDPADDLSVTMREAFLRAVASGAERVVFLNAGHPAPPLEFVEKAFQSLDGIRSVCVGPDDAGGWYLLGMNDFFPDVLFVAGANEPGAFDLLLATVAESDGSLTVLPLLAAGV